MVQVRELILNNFWQKVFSLVLATLIWFTIDQAYLVEVELKPALPGTPMQTNSFRRPIKIMTSAAGQQQSFKVDPTEVDVEVRGDNAKLNELNEEDIKVYVDLSDVDPTGLTTSTQFPVQMNHPKDISVLVWPPVVEITPLNGL